MNENFLQAILQSIAWLLTRLLSVLTPLFIGLAIAYLLHAFSAVSSAALLF